LEAIFENDMRFSEQLTWQNFGQRTVLRRAGESMARLLSPIL
jgi:hypothetical protein